MKTLKRQETKKTKKTTEIPAVLGSPFVLYSQQFPATALQLSGLTRYRKELIKIGKFVKDSTKQSFEVTGELIDHWVKTFGEYMANGLKVPIPAGHENEHDAEKNKGWVTKLFRENNVLVGILEILDESLVLTNDVSVCIVDQVIDGEGRKYELPITHVALTPSPVIPGLGDFVKLSLSEEKGSIMDKKELNELLGLDEGCDDEVVLAEVKRLKALPEQPSLKTVDPLLAKVVAENRTGKVETLLSSGKITPAVKDLIDKKYIESKALTLSLSTGIDDGFDLLIDILQNNKPLPLGETSGLQVVELANTRQESTNVIKQDVDRRRALAGLDN